MNKNLDNYSLTLTDKIGEVNITVKCIQSTVSTIENKLADLTTSLRDIDIKVNKHIQDINDVKC